jgi:hypothetical protein
LKPIAKELAIELVSGLACEAPEPMIIELAAVEEANEPMTVDEAPEAVTIFPSAMAALAVE